MKPNGDARTLLYDLEITPILAWVYDMFDANVIRVERPKLIMSFAYKWLDENEIHVVAQPDFKRYKRDKHDDKDVVIALHSLLDEADIVVAHNANGFDNKVANARFLYHGFPPPSPYVSVDTLVTARRTFKFGANSLQFLCEQLGIGTKSSIRHHDLWRQCIDGDEMSWLLMKEYNAHDVELLEGLYWRLRPYMHNHPIVSLKGCPKCGSGNVQYRGTQRSKVGTYQRVQCQDCGAWSREPKATGDKPQLV